MNNQQNGFNHERAGQKRERDMDEGDSECLPISKRINSLSLDTPYAQRVGTNGWSAAGPSGSLPPPAAPVPVSPGAGPSTSRAPPALSSEPDLRPEECPEYYNINCYLYRLHVERQRRQQGGQF